jgi:hypothetical protein
MDIEAAEAAYAHLNAAELAQMQEQMLKIQPDPSALAAIKYDDSGTYFQKSDNATLNREHGEPVTDIHTKHGQGFWSEIRIHEDDFIFYKLFRGNFLVRLTHKLGFKKITDINGADKAWDYIGGQGHKDCKLEATLGKTFLLIDKMIADELKDEEHRKFIKGIAKTDPENLKMIAGLKILDEGMTAPLDDIKLPDLNGASRPGIVPQGRFNQVKKNLSVSASDAAAAAWTPKGGMSICNAGEEIVRIDKDSNVTFGDKVAKAIKEVADEDEIKLQAGKAP